jgi:DNA-binding HxlR family transcriptional regulator
MVPTSNGFADNRVQDLRQQLADILSVGPLRGTTTGAPAKIAAQEAGSVPLSRDQELGEQRANLALEAAFSPLATPQAKFLPMAPRSLEEAGLTESEVESLVLKYLLQARTATGAEITRQLALPFNVLEKLLNQMKQNRLLVYKSVSSLHDYVYELTEQGIALGRSYAQPRQWPPSPFTA